MNCSIINQINNLEMIIKKYDYQDLSLHKKALVLYKYLKNLKKEEINNISDLKIFLISVCSNRNILNLKNSTSENENDFSHILKDLDFKKIKRNIKKKQIINKFSDILVLQIQKFIFYDEFSGAAMSKLKVEFPLCLNVNEKGNKIKYELYSFLQHIGSSEYGHYFSFKKYSDNKWVLLNDSNIIKIDLEKIKEADPYMLFYKKSSM